MLFPEQLLDAEIDLDEKKRIMQNLLRIVEVMIPSFCARSIQLCIHVLLLNMPRVSLKLF